MRLRVQILCLAFFVSLSANDLDVDLSGSVQSNQGVRIKKPNDFLSSRTKAQFDANVFYDRLFSHLSLNLVQNEIIKDETGLRLKEGFVAFEGDYADVRIGRQIIVWGKADGFLVVDLISPKDYSEFLARDFDDMRLGVDAAKVRFLGDVSTLEIVAIPFFTPALIEYEKYGEDKNPWASVLPKKMVLKKSAKPSSDVQNWDLAMRLNFATSDFDLGLFWLKLWDDVGVFELDGKTLNLLYKRQNIVGLNLAVPFDIFVFRLESAFYMDRFLNRADFSSPIKKQMSVNLLGLDGSFDNLWNASVQVYWAKILDYEAFLQARQEEAQVSFNLSKKLLRETLDLGAMIFFDINNDDYYLRSKASYDLNDNTRLDLGVDIFDAKDKASSFGRFKNNDQVFFTFKYSFTT